MVKGVVFVVMNVLDMLHFPQTCYIKNIFFSFAETHKGILQYWISELRYDKIPICDFMKIDHSSSG
jgi:hypothetical protein